MRCKRAIPFLVALALSGFVSFLHGTAAQTIIQVDTWRDDNYLSSDNYLKPLLAADICATAAVNCSLRAAFWYASSLPGDDVEISLNAGEDVLLTQGDYIPITGPSTLTLYGNGYTVRETANGSFFLVNGSIDAAIYDASFEDFHHTQLGEEAANGVVISAGDSLSSLKISGCTFRGSYSVSTGSPAGIGGAVYSTGSLQIENTTFEDNRFVLLNSVTNSSSTTPSPAGSTNLTESPVSATILPTNAPVAASNVSSPDATSPTNGTANTTADATPSPVQITPSPVAAGNFSSGNATVSNNGTANSTANVTPSPIQITPSPVAAGNFSSGNATVSNNGTANSTANVTPSPIQITPSPVAAGNFSGNATVSNNGTANSTANVTPSPIQITPSPVAAGNFSGNATVSNNGTANSTANVTPSPIQITPSPVAAGNFSGNATVSNNGTANSTANVTPSPIQITPSPVAAGNFSGNATVSNNGTANSTITPAPVAAGNFSSPNATISNNGTDNVTTNAMSNPSQGRALTPTPVAAGNISTPAPTSAVVSNGMVNVTTDAMSNPSQITPSPVTVGNISMSAPSSAVSGNGVANATTDTMSNPMAAGNISTPAPSFTAPSSGTASVVTSTSAEARTPRRRLSTLSSSSSSEGTSNETEGRMGAAVYWNNYAQDPTKVLNITGCQFMSNYVTTEDEDSWGGGVVALGGEVNISNTVFWNNSASFGGGLVVLQATLTLADSVFSENAAGKYGGAMVQVSAGSMDVQDTLFSFNTAGEGGGALAVATVSTTDRYTLTDCEFNDNTAGSGGGGAVYVMVDLDAADADDGGILKLTSPTFADNTAPNGSIISINCGNVEVESADSEAYEEDEEGFFIPTSLEACSSLTFITPDTSPVLSSARISDIGASIVLTFDMDTDYGANAGLGASFDCPLLLSYPGSSDSDLCSWTSAASVTATLHYNATVAPSDSITVLAGKVAGLSAPDLLNEESSVQIKAPENPPVPILVPEVWYTALAHCKDLVVDVSSSTGGGGRTMLSYQWDLYDWTVQHTSDEPVAELDYVIQASASGGSSSLTIPALGRLSEMEVTWFFNVTATNWLGGVGWNGFEVLVSAETEDPPLLSLLGGSTRTMLRASTLTITAQTEVVTCVSNKTSGLSYDWSELNTGDIFTSTSADPSMFRLPSHSLDIGTTYEFRVNVTDSAGYSSIATQTITVESSELIAAVSGGNSTISGGEDVVLDLTASIDPDEEDGACQDCVYSASCTGTLSGADCDLTLADGEFTSGQLTFEADALVSEETYTLEVYVRRTTETTLSTAYTFFTVGGEDPIPSLDITPLSAQKVNTDATVAIVAEITSSLDSGATAEWGLTEGILNGYEDLSSAVVSSLGYTIAGMGVLSANLVLSANALVAGSSYTFALTATYVSDGRRLQEDLSSSSSSSSSLATITILANTPPAAGVFEVSPGEGMALTNQFELNTYAWEDDVDDLPITYTFAYVSGSANESDTSGEVVLQAASESSEASGVYLPQGYGSNSTLFTSMYATDTLGAASRSTFGIIVTPYEGGVEDLSGVVGDVATAALEAGDTDAVMQVLDVASSSLNAANCSAAPDCATLNRDDCGTDGLREANTCGECASGSVGVLGAANSHCVDTTALDSSCSNEAMDGDETDVDCGGSSCVPCLAGSTCLVDSDCYYNNCPEASSSGTSQTCVTPAKACPNDCGTSTRGACEYFSSSSSAVLNSTQCLADASAAACWASCTCLDGYGGDGCQYTLEELEVAKEIRQSSLEYAQEAAEASDVNQETISRQATLLAKLSVVPQEMQNSSVALTLELASDTAHLADESGSGVASTAATALVEIIGQLTLASANLGEESDVSGLSGMLGSLISAQVTGKVVGENAEEASSDYFRLSTGVYDAATVGGVQISPPLTAADETVGRSAPIVGMPSEITDALTGVSSLSLAVAEWIIDPRKTGNATSSTNSTNVVSTILRLYVNSVETTSSRRRRARRTTDVLTVEKRRPSGPRYLLEDLGDLELVIPNSVSQAWDPQEVTTFNHTCDWDSTETLSSVCPNGTEISTVCTGTALTREVECSSSGTEPECAWWEGSDGSAGSLSAQYCEVVSFNDSWTTYSCDYAATVGDGTGSNQVDFASTFLDTPGEFISIWSEVVTLTWSEVQSATPVFATMGSIIALAIICAGLGWRFDQKDRGRTAGLKDWLNATVCALFCCCCCCRRAKAQDASKPNHTGRYGYGVGKRSAPAGPRKMTHDQNLKDLTAVSRGTRTNNVETTAPHHLGERRVKSSMKLLLMVHHDFVSVFYCFYEWFTRPQRVALLLCTVVTLMAADATVFATIMFKDDGTCEGFSSAVDCTGSDTTNVNVAGVGSSCTWDQDSRTCYLSEPEDDMETSLIISTISLIIALPFELAIIALFAAFIVRPTVRSWSTAHPENRADTSMKNSMSESGKSRHGNTDGSQARLKVELAFARETEHKGGGKLKCIWRIMCCGLGVCTSEASKEARLVKRVKSAMGPAIELEQRMAKTSDVHEQEAILFERAEADSLSHVERKVFFKSRILNFGEENDLSPVSTCTKLVAWFVVVAYAVGMAFYVCLFAVKAGEATSVQWMISFWLAFAEDILVLIPLKLAFIYLFLPSLMRHRMRPDMFTRIPKHAPSVQIARRRPDLQVSRLILEGSIPVGSEYEKFIPLFHPEKRWLAWLTGTVFATLALIMVLPDTLQAMVVDLMVAVFVGGGLFGLGKLFPVSLWGFLLFFVLAAVLLVSCRYRHRKMVKAEKSIRQSRAGVNILNFGATEGGRFSGVNFARSSRFVGATRHFNTPPPATPNKNSAGRSPVPLGKRGEVATQEREALDVGTGALYRWVSARKPEAFLSGTPPGSNSPRPRTPPSSNSPRPHLGRGKFGGGPYRAGPHLPHGRLDSCAASGWGDGPVSESVFSPRSDISMGSDCGKESRAHWLAQSSRILQGSEWNGLGNTGGSVLSNNDFSDTTGSSIFFNGTGRLGPQARGSMTRIGVEEGEEGEEEDEEGGEEEEDRPAGRMSQTGSPWQELNAQYQGRPQVDGAEDGDAMSRWDGSPMSTPATGLPPARRRPF